MRKLKQNLWCGLFSIFVFLLFNDCKRTDTTTPDENTSKSQASLAPINEIASKPEPNKTTRPSSDELEYTSKYTESELEKWKPDPNKEKVPRQSIRDTTINIEGNWLVHRGLDSSTLTIERRGSGKYDVEFYSTGCLSRLKLRRTATYSDGALILSRPVQEYFPRTYNRLYTIRVDGEECLIPSCSVADLQENLDNSDHQIPEKPGIRFWTFGRTQSRRNPLSSGK